MAFSLTPFVEDSPVRISPSLEKALALQELEAASGPSTPVWLANYAPALSLWKTSQLCLDGDLEQFSETWPRSGMTRNGTAFLLPPLVLRTYGTGFGSSPTHSIPTPTASDHIERESISTETLNYETNKSVSLDRFAKRWPTPHGMCVPNKRRAGPSGNELGRAVNQSLWPTPTIKGNYNKAGLSKKSGDGLATAIKNRPMLWQTPVSDDAVERKAGKFNSRGEPKLSAQVKKYPTPRATDGDRGGRGDLLASVRGYKTQRAHWPTPKAQNAKMSGPSRVGNRMDLQTAVQHWPTPTGRDWKDGSAKACENVPANGLLGRVVHQWRTPQARDGISRGPQSPEKREAGGHSVGLGDQIGGSLNPTWVEWLMGFPLGWTDCGRSETRSSRKLPTSLEGV
jgi:hypothetical protein